MMTGFFGPFFGDVLGPFFGTIYEAAPASPTVNYCTVSGNFFDICGSVPGVFEVRLNKSKAKYGSINTVIWNKIYPIEVSEDGSFSVDLADSESMESGTYYIFNINGIETNLIIPDQSAVDFEDLVEYEV